MNDGITRLVLRYQDTGNPIELFPHRKVYESWGQQTRLKWKRTVMTTLYLYKLAEGLEFGYFNQWGPRQDDTLGWLGEPDFMEDTDHVSTDSVSFQHGYCPGCMESAFRQTDDRMFLIICGTKDKPF